MFKGIILLILVYHLKITIPFSLSYVMYICKPYIIHCDFENKRILILNYTKVKDWSTMAVSNERKSFMNWKYWYHANMFWISNYDFVNNTLVLWGVVYFQIFFIQCMWQIKSMVRIIVYGCYCINSQNFHCGKNISLSILKIQITQYNVVWRK